MEYEEKLLNGLLHWKDNPTGKWICFDKIELVSKVRFLQKENNIKLYFRSVDVNNELNNIFYADLIQNIICL